MAGKRVAAPGPSESVGGDLLKGILGNPQVQQTLVAGIFGLLSGLIAKLFGQGKSVTVPASERPPVDEVPDDKIAPPVPKPVVPAAKPGLLSLGYTAVKLGIMKAQYNHELFPAEYTEDNKFGLYKGPDKDAIFKAHSTKLNRRSKVWFDATPFKGAQPVQQDEGAADGILWKPRFHLFYNGEETVVYANEAVLGPAGEPIQVVYGESVGVGVSAWQFAKGYLCQINVGDNEGPYSAYVEIPALQLRSETLTWEVS